MSNGLGVGKGLLHSDHVGGRPDNDRQVLYLFVRVTPCLQAESCVLALNGYKLLP